MKKILFVLIALSVFGVTRSQAQDYNWAIGVRGGFYASGVTVKYNFDPTNTIEAIVAFDRGVNVFGLYERNIPVITQGFNFFYGAGVNLGSWRKSSENKFTAGIDGIAGLEYKIQSIPLAFSIDYKPNLNFAGHTGFHGLDFGLSMRVTF